MKKKKKKKITEKENIKMVQVLFFLFYLNHFLYICNIKDVKHWYQMIVIVLVTHICVGFIKYVYVCICVCGTHCNTSDIADF